MSGSTLLGAMSIPKRAARKVQREIRKLIDPSNIDRFRREIAFPLRNAVLRNKPIMANAGGRQLKLAPMGAIAAGLWSGVEYEPAELGLISRLLKPDSVFLDVGANVGIFSLFAAKVFPSARIFAFEPAAKTFKLLARNIWLNDAQNVTPVRSALGSSSGQAKMHVNVAGKDGLNTLGVPSHPDCELAGTEIVPITTLDEFLAVGTIARVDVMKVDAEGAELFIMEGAKELLQRNDAPVLLYEAFSFLTRGFAYHPVEIYWLLERWGFAFFTLSSETGKLAAPASSRAYDSMIVAVKPSHPSYSAIKDFAR